VRGQRHALAATYPLEWTVTHCGWASRPVWTGSENLAPTDIRSPDRPARRQSLYQLHYRAHLTTKILVKCKHRTVIQIQDCMQHHSNPTKDKRNRHNIESRAFALHRPAAEFTGCKMIIVVICRKSMVPSVGLRLYLHNISFCQRQNIFSCVFPLLLDSLASSSFQQSLLSRVSA
jgi:hypothetical protein